MILNSQAVSDPHQKNSRHFLINFWIYFLGHSNSFCQLCCYFTSKWITKVTFNVGFKAYLDFFENKQDLRFDAKTMKFPLSTTNKQPLTADNFFVLMAMLWSCFLSGTDVIFPVIFAVSNFCELLQHDLQGCEIQFLHNRGIVWHNICTNSYFIQGLLIDCLIFLDWCVFWLHDIQLGLIDVIMMNFRLTK